jgi:hypothetical protein
MRAFKDAIVGLIATFLPIFGIFYFRTASVMTEELAIQSSQALVGALSVFIVILYIIYRKKIMQHRFCKLCELR